MKDESFVWGSEQQLVFKTMITTFTARPALRHFDYEKDVIIGTHAPDYVSAGVLSQRDDDAVLHP